MTKNKIHIGGSVVVELFCYATHLLEHRMLIFEVHKKTGNMQNIKHKKKCCSGGSSSFPQYFITKSESKSHIQV